MRNSSRDSDEFFYFLIQLISTSNEPWQELQPCDSFTKLFKFAAFSKWRVYIKYLKQEVDVCQNSGKKQLLQSTGHCICELHSLFEIHGKLFGNITYLFYRKSSPNYPRWIETPTANQKSFIVNRSRDFSRGETPDATLVVTWEQRL